ncbi:MAG: hypothetical protein WC813_00925 [Patescibacteria group bacterium]|jgi:hypothetical protein
MAEYQHSVKSGELLVLPQRPQMGAKTMLHSLPGGKSAIFGVMVIDSKDEEGRDRLLHMTASHLEHLSADASSELNSARRFEQMLGALNTDLLAAAHEMNLKMIQVQGVVGMATRDQIFFSGIGNIDALFLHKTADKRFSVYELHDQFGEGRTPDDPRYFHTILDGETHGGDVFYVATPVSTHALRSDELHDILVTLPPASALQRIKQFVPPGDVYAAVSFSFAEEEKPSGPPKKANPIGSLTALQSSKDRTANVLGESNTELSSLVKNVTQSIRQSLSAPGTRGAVAILKRGLALMLTLAQKTFTAVAALASNIFLANTKGRKGAPVITPLRAGILFSILLVIVLGTGLFYLSKGRGERAKAELQFSQTVKSIDDRILAAQASLIYRNTEEARKSLTEAQSILETLPKNTADQKKQVTDLLVKLHVVEDKIRGIIAVSPQTLATMADSANGNGITSITETSGSLFAITSNLDVYRLDGLKSAWTKEEATKGILESVRSMTPEGGNALVMDLNKQLGRVDLTAHTVNPLQSGTNAMLSVEDIITYGSNLYALSAGSGQIVKMRPIGTAYEAGTPWIISKDSDLSTAQALTIDGDVYVLLKHDVVKFHAGKEVAWTHASFDPALINPTDIWTDVASKYLYVLDPGTSRVVVLDKTTGNLEAQYTNDSFKNAVGFTVEESANRIIVVTGDKALGFTADHLVK